MGIFRCSFLETIGRDAWVKRTFRLTRSIDLKRVRNFGKSYAHPLVVLIAIRSTEDRWQEVSGPRVGIIAGRSVGGAIQRNRAKRLLREAIRALLSTIRPGWDLVLIARQPLPEANYQQVQAAISQLVRRADLFTSEQS
jgi:ribonuclease P protein component